MGLLDTLGLPVPGAAKSGVSAANQNAGKNASVLAPMATVVMHNASAAPLQFSGASIVNMARWHTPPPRTMALHVVKPTQVEVLAPTSDAVLTLVTCFPFYSEGEAPHRMIVRAVAVRSAAEVAPGAP